jgi:hypothetical protein
MKKLVLPIAIVLMMVLIAAAYVWDSVRAAASARHRVDLADQEMQRHEQRLLKLLTEHPEATAEVKAAVASFQNDADTPQKRRDAYAQVVASFNSTMAVEIDATNPLKRKFIDDVTGAMNRREIAQKQYDEESTAYQRFLGGFRGRLARLLSPSARADVSSAD